MDLETSGEMRSLYRIGGTAALLQLVVILGYALVAAVFGPKPETADAYFAVYLESPLVAALRGDFLLLILIGIAAVSLSLALIVWSVGFAHRQHGASVMGLPFLGLLLFGGGIAAQVVFAPFVWATARHINRPMDWWRKALPEGIRPTLAQLWPFTLALGSLSFLIGLFIAITGYVPGVTDDESILAVCWALVFCGGLGLYLLSFVAGFAHDVEQTVGR